MRNLYRVAFIALGLTELWLILLLAPLLHPRHMAVYHWTGPAQTLFLPTFLDVTLLWLLLTLLLYLARSRVVARYVVLAIFFLTPWIAIAEWDLLRQAPFPAFTLTVFYAASAICFTAAALWRRSFTILYRWAFDFTATALFFFGIGGAFLLAQLTWFAWQARGLNDPSPPHDIRKASSRPRVLWIVFDELSFQQIYERRYPGLQLPAFDVLATQSTVFTHVISAGIFTDSVLPSLMSGDLVDTVRSSPRGQLYVHPAGTTRWRLFDPRQTVFQDALDAGHNSSVAGWYLPYCRLFAAVTDQCQSSYEIATKSGMSPRWTVAKNMLNPISNIANAAIRSTFFARFSRRAADESSLHIADYQNLTQASEDLLADRTANFVLLHLPIPHLGGIYDRATGQLTSGPSTYLDNLALADKCLSELRSKLEQTGQWDSATIVLMGDHSWRTTQMWSSEAAWTTEEDKASRGGTFDDRPAYLVKLANQKKGLTIDHPFQAMRTRSLLKALLKEEIKTPDQLEVWSKSQP